MARLCILREDLFLEWHGVMTNEIKSLDSGTAEFRRLYFFRHSVGTLFEIKRALQAIQQIKSFRRAVSKATKEDREELNELNKRFESIYKEIKTIRHHMVCHIEPTPIQKALADMATDQKGLIQHSTNPRDIHYKFTRELLVGILNSNFEGDERLSRLLEEIGKILPALVLIDKIFVIYGRRRRILLGEI